VLLFAKAVASGLPLGGLIAERALLERWPPGTHGSTFGGNPVSCAAALATLDVIDEQDLCRRADVLGARLLDRLQSACAGLPGVLDVRGLGLMIGIELVTAAMAASVQAACLREGMLVLTCGPG